MKKVLLATALVLSVISANAQPKTAASAQKAVTKALTAANDAKKAAKVATWFNLADAYIGAYDQPTKDLISGTMRTEVKMILGNQQVLSTEPVKVAGKEYTVDHYADKDLYYNEAGILDFYMVTTPAVDGDLLCEAEKALLKAAELDTKNSRTEEITAKLEDIHNKLGTEAINNYYLGNYAVASDLFEKSLSSFDNALVNKVDSLNIYYTAITANLAGNTDKAVKFYNKCIEMGTYQQGNVFFNLAEIYTKIGNAEMARKTLEEGFVKCPDSQNVIIGLINIFRESGEDTQKLFDLLHAAQVKEPKNASLYYVEGDVYKKLGDVENAEKLFRKATEIDPTYVFGILSVGVLYYDNAVALQEKANNEPDDAKYGAIIEEMNKSLKTAIEPFEEAFKMTDDAELKPAIAEYLKNIYFRFRTEDGYKEKYDFYNDFLKK